MFCTGSAGFRDLLAERLARPKDAHARIGGRDTCLFGVVLDGDPVELDALEGLGVLRLECLRELAHALTHDATQLAVILGDGFARERLGAAFCGRAPAIVIDDRVAKDPVEPADGALVDRLELAERLHERILDDLLGERTIAADATLHEREEVAMTRDEGCQVLAQSEKRSNRYA